MRIALTGAHGVGKTTLIGVLAPQLYDFGEVKICREAPRLIVEAIGDTEFFRRGNNQLSRQALIFLEHVMEERRAAEAAKVVLSDRTLVDHLAYTLALFPEATETPEIQTYRRLAFESLASYDALFYLPIEFAPLDDGVREGDLAFQKQIDQTICALYLQANITPFIVRGSVDERAAQIIRHFRNHG